MKGIIIAGGLGTRLRPLTDNRPKHLLPVANRPFLEYQIDLLRRHGILEVIFATGYRADMIEAHFGDGTAFGVRMRYAIEEAPLGTAGAIRNAAQLTPGEAVLVLNGDILTDFDLSEIVAFHRERGAAATIALRAIERPHGFGALELGPDGRVISWNEPTEAQKKAVAENPGPKTGEFDAINAGVYILEPSVIEAIPGDRPVSIERETYPQLIAGDSGVYGVSPAGFWLDIGRPEQYLAANSAVLQGAVKTNVGWMAVAEGARVDGEAAVDETTALGRNVSVGAGSRLAGCIILDNARIGSGVELTAVIADEGSAVEDSVVSRGAVLASGEVLRWSGSAS